jgi:hypothetical protein
MAEQLQGPFGKVRGLTLLLRLRFREVGRAL